MAKGSTATLPGFEGRDVLQAAIALTKVGDGLSDAMTIDPVALHHGEEVYLVVLAEVSQVNHVPVNGTDALVRKHTLVGKEVAIVDAASVDALLAAERERIRKAKEEAAGQSRLADDASFAGDPKLSDTEKAAAAAKKRAAKKTAASKKIADQAGSVTSIDQAKGPKT